MIIPNPKTFHDAIKPIVYFNCIFGVGALRQPNRSSSTYIFMRLYTVLIVLINWTTIYITLNSIRGLTASEDTSHIALGMLKALVCTNASITMITPLLVWFQRKGLMECLQKMSILDNTFQVILGASNGYRKQFISLTRQLIIIWLTMLLVGICGSIFDHGIESQLNMQSPWTSYCVTQTLHQPIGIMLVLDLNFKSFVRYLGKKFRDLNDNLPRLVDNPSTTCPSERLFVISKNAIKTISGNEVKDTEAGSLMDEKHYLLREIRKAHLELCKLSRKINLLFGIQNLLSTGISFVMITGLLYTIYSIILWKNFTIDKIEKVFPPVLWTAIYIYKIWMINHTCWSISNEAKKTEEVIYELLNRRVDKEFRVEIQEFGIQMLQNPIRFNACGFFILDYSLVQGVIGSITTYLVILIQMSQVSENSTNTAYASNHTEILPN